VSPVGLTLLTPPVQAAGGGWNSVLTIPGGPLQNGGFIDVNLALRVGRAGAYRVFATAESRPPTVVVAPKRAFVTSTSPIDAAFGGIAFADGECAARASAASLGGAWLAWLSDSTTSPAARFTQSTGPYTRVNGTLIAANWADLTDGTLINGVSLDEFGNPVTNAEVWTGTLSNGSPMGGAVPNYCSDWTRNDAAFPYTYVGTSDASTASWTTVYVQFCNRSFLRLYCFEQ
jgi:hypothetical protein